MKYLIYTLYNTISFSAFAGLHFGEKNTWSPNPFRRDMSVRTEVRIEVEADIHDIQHNDLEGGIDNRSFGKFFVCHSNQKDAIK